MFDRQIQLIGRDGQEKLQKSKVAIIGIGALGTVAAQLLARAGVPLVLIDRDIVEEHNLQRQTLFVKSDIGKPKVVAAKEKLDQISSHIVTKSISLDHKNIKTLNVDLIIDCTDNLKTRFIINDFCKKNKTPWIYGSAIKTSGYVMPIIPDGPCFSCFSKEASLDTCDTVGVLNAITSLIASMQVSFATKILLKVPIKTNLYHFNVWEPTMKELRIKKNPNCKTCNGTYQQVQPETKFIRFCSTGKYQIHGKPTPLTTMKEKWEKIDKVTFNGALSFKNITIFKDGRALIKADSEEEALSSYSKWVGN